MTSRRFGFRFEQRYALAALPFGVMPATACVEVGDGRLVARFGPWRVETALANISGWRITGPYAWVKTAGPARLTLSDHGLTFATNSDQGLCLELREPVTGISPFGPPRHPNLTLTVADCSGLAAAIDAGG